MATQLENTHRFTETEFQRMAEGGIIPHASAELIGGRVVVDGEPWRFSTQDYYRLAETGILREDDRVELIDGEILEMTAIGSRHAGAVNRLVFLLYSAFGDSVVVSAQHPLDVEDGTEPEPDIMVLRPRTDFYTESHPTAADVLLLIEVAETSLGYDRGEKADLYAAAGIVEYWLADLTRKRVLVHTGPTPAGYARVDTMDYEATWTSQALPSLTVGGKEIFGE
jgi:Uma2 family endonuclease